MSGSIKDKSYNDIKANAERELDEVKETVEETFHESVDKVRNAHITANQKLLLVGAAAVVASVAAQNFFRRLRAPEMIVNQLLVVDDEFVEDVVEGDLS